MGNLTCLHKIGHPSFLGGNIKAMTLSAGGTQFLYGFFVLLECGGRFFDRGISELLSLARKTNVIVYDYFFSTLGFLWF